MAGTNPPRNVIYFGSNANHISLAGIGNLPYTDVIIAFLVPDSNLKLVGAGGAFDDHLQSNIRALQNAGKNVLISFGGATFPAWPAQSSAYQRYECRLSTCAVRRRRFPVGASPPGDSLQPEATGAGMEETKCLKPSDSWSRIGDRASVQAATRVNAEQTSKRTICRPTR
jgi:hypothetical protein